MKKFTCDETDIKIVKAMGEVFKETNALDFAEIARKANIEEDDVILHIMFSHNKSASFYEFRRLTNLKISRERLNKARGDLNRLLKMKQDYSEDEDVEIRAAIDDAILTCKSLIKDREDEVNTLSICEIIFTEKGVKFVQQMKYASPIINLYNAELNRKPGDVMRGLDSGKLYNCSPSEVNI